MSSDIDQLSKAAEELKRLLQEQVRNFAEVRQVVNELSARLGRDYDEVNYLTDDEQKLTARLVELAAGLINLASTNALIQAAKTPLN